MYATPMWNNGAEALSGLMNVPPPRGHKWHGGLYPSAHVCWGHIEAQPALEMKMELEKVKNA